MSVSKAFGTSVGRAALKQKKKVWNPSPISAFHSLFGPPQTKWEKKGRPIDSKSLRKGRSIATLFLSRVSFRRKGLRIPNPVGPDGFVCPSLANRIPAQRHCLWVPYRSRSVFATAGKAVVEAKPIATPTIKYEIGPLLKDLMEWPSPPKSAYVISELMAGNNPYGFDIR